VPLLQKLWGFAGFGSSSESRPTRHFAHLKPETAKPSAVTQPTALPSSPNAAVAPQFPQAAFGRVIEPGPAWVCTLSPLSFRDCGDAQSDQRSIARSSAQGCAFRATLLQKKRSAGNQLPWSDLCEHLGMGMSPGEVIAYRLYAVFASRSLESLRTLGARLRCLASRRLGQSWPSSLRKLAISIPNGGCRRHE
jgi:hypothetical protein